ncbi:MAG: preprotein translocase subunit YajC [Bacteroidia bacterium]|nr:preprotein translocase subunit YajC [Bacteroidia bacterium]
MTLLATQAQPSFITGTLPMILMMLAVFYFFFILPNQKKAKKQKGFMSELKKGDRIITNGGIHGKVISMDDKTVTIDCEGSKFKLEKSGISMEMRMPLNAPVKAEEAKA